MQYWQIGYYNIHLDTTFVMDDSFPDKRRLWQRVCRSWTREEDKLWKHKLCYDFGWGDRFSYNGQTRDAAEDGKHPQGYKRENATLAEAMCERFCPEFLGMGMIASDLMKDAQVVFVLQDVKYVLF